MVRHRLRFGVTWLTGLAQFRVIMNRQAEASALGFHGDGYREIAHARQSSNVAARLAMTGPAQRKQVLYLSPRPFLLVNVVKSPKYYLSHRNKRDCAQPGKPARADACSHSA